MIVTYISYILVYFKSTIPINYKDIFKTTYFVIHINEKKRFIIFLIDVNL